MYALRSVGVGYSGFEKLCGFLNLSRQITQKNYDYISDMLGESAKSTGEQSMNNAANDLHKKSDEISNVGVSVDGTWQRRGDSSLNGTVAVISMDNGKLLDIESITRQCKPCQRSKESLSEEDFDVWYTIHQKGCSMNYAGSAPMIEVEGAKRISGRSISNRKLRYLKYYGDGDSKAFATVRDCYLPLVMLKLECIGHYQKRLGCRLRKLKKIQKV